jgi:hypothetical protein
MPHEVPDTVHLFLAGKIDQWRSSKMERAGFPHERRIDARGERIDGVVVVWSKSAPTMRPINDLIGTLGR